MWNSATYQMILSLQGAPAIIQGVAFFLAWIGVWLPLGVPLAIALKWRPGQPITPQQKLPLVASLYLLAPLLLWGAAQLQGLTIAGYGFSTWSHFWRSLVLGWAMGVGGLAILFGCEFGLGWLKWQRPKLLAETPERPSAPAFFSLLASVLLPTLLLGLWVSVTEEFIFRGFLLNQLQQDYAAGVSAAIASLIFALLHLVWEGRENLPQLPGLWLMGMVLSLARWADGGSLGLACGLHAGWIWAIASLDTLQLVTYTQQVPTWLTGLDDKPLAGGMGLLFLLGTGLLLWQWF
jgi:membrane protease YdiL (CAAX protease family)